MRYIIIYMLRRLGAFFFEITQLLVFAISIFLVIYLLVLQPHKIKGSSMEPNFHDSEYLLTDKLSYRVNSPQRGDVIVFKAPPDYKDEYIKRIIGLPGDTVAIDKGQIYVNGKPLEENYLPLGTLTQPGKIFEDGKIYNVPPSSYIVFGDNRNHSLDSRAFGAITKDKITGKAWIIYWPPQSIGTIQKPVYAF